jgi:hypothetical protein
MLVRLRYMFLLLQMAMHDFTEKIVGMMKSEKLCLTRWSYYPLSGKY